MTDIIVSRSLFSVLIATRHQSIESAEQYKKTMKHAYKDMFDWYEGPTLIVEETKPGNYGVFVEYFATQNHFESQRTTKQKIGRYLTANYKDWSQGKRDEIANYMKKYIPAEIQFTKDGAESVQVYLDGPDSCMSHDTDEYASYPKHPCIVYDITKGDLCVAYMKKEGRITARAIVWPDKKLYGRIYGDCSQFAPAIKKMGYTGAYRKDDISFVGAKLPYIPHCEGFVFPYFDGMTNVSVLANQKHVVLHNKWDKSDIPNLVTCETHTPDSQTGVTPEYEDDRPYCEFCEGNADEVSYVESSQQYVCDYCLENHFSTCDQCGEIHLDSDSHRGEHGEVYCSVDCYSENYTVCEQCDDEIGITETKEYDNETLCKDCYKDAKEKEEEEDTE